MTVIPALTKPRQVGARSRGSVRFAPYYKLQEWLPIALAWRDVQARHDTPEDAEAARPAGRTRIMEITERGRAPLAGSIRD